MSYPDDNNLTELSKVKTWLRIKSADTNADTDLGALITRVSNVLTREIRRKPFKSASTAETRSGNGKTYLLTRAYPVTAISSVTIDGIVIPQRATTLGFGWSFVPGTRTIFLDGYRFNLGNNNIVLQMTAGVDANSEEWGMLEQACIETVVLKWRRRDHLDQASQNLGGMPGTQITVFTTKDFPDEVRETINKLRDRVPIWG